MSLQTMREKLFCEGFVTLSDEFEPLQKKIDEVFEEYAPASPRNGKLFRNKYQNAFDLIDEEKRESIRQMIMASNLERYVTNVVGGRIRLSHVQLRFVRVNKTSYMPLHRDVHSYNDLLVGPLPVPFKVIFYPKNISENDTLKVVPRSHRRCFGMRFVDHAVNLMLSGLVSIKFG